MNQPVKLQETHENKVVVIVDNGVVQEVLTTSGMVQCLVLDREDPNGAKYVSAAGSTAALDAMEQRLPKVARDRGNRAVVSVENALSQARFVGDESAQRILASLRESPSIGERNLQSSVPTVEGALQLIAKMARSTVGSDGQIFLVEGDVIDLANTALAGTTGSDQQRLALTEIMTLAQSACRSEAPLSEADILVIAEATRTGKVPVKPITQGDVSVPEQTSYLDYVKGLPLQEALWWFIENGHDDLAERSKIFFALRERVREEQSSRLPEATDTLRIAGLVLEGGDESVLDSVVHDECSAFAAGVNNDGAEAQIKYLLSNGWTEAMILKEAGLDQAPTDVLPRP